MPVIEEVGDYLQAFTDLFNGNDKKNFVPVPTTSQSTSISSSSSSALLLSSIQSLSTFPTGETVPPSLSQLYHAVTSTSATITPISVQTPMQQSTTEESRFFKIPLHIPSFSLSSSVSKISWSLHHHFQLLACLSLPLKLPPSQYCLQILKQLLF